MWCHLLLRVICNVHMEDDVPDTTQRYLLPVCLVHGWYLWAVGLLNTGKIFWLVTKSKRLTRSYKHSSLDPLFRQKKSRMVWGRRFFLFSFSSFQDPSVEEDALIYALELQLGSCTVLNVWTLLKRHECFFQSSWSPCGSWHFVGPQHNCVQDLLIKQAAATSRIAGCCSLLLLCVVAPRYVVEW